jgi:hypothetical protein
VWRWDSVVTIVTGYGLDDLGVGVQVSVGSRIVSFHIVQASSGVHPMSYRMGTRGSFPRAKQLGHEDSLQTSAEAKKTWIYISIPPYAFMV